MGHRTVPYREHPYPADSVCPQNAPGICPTEMPYVLQAHRLNPVYVLWMRVCRYRTDSPGNRQKLPYPEMQPAHVLSPYLHGIG